mmetsp:Transcript_19853/g.31083  ORF Transcript_19853/g.31083 Transcript_19853/m.31083 type:complete len:200 (-) Transcript_19853:191-790(-)
MQGLVMTVIAVFGVQHVCDFFGLSSSVTIIAQILCFFILPRFLGGASKSIVGEKAPPISDLQYVQGEPVELGNGKVTVVEFWATWCPPCRTSIPHLNEVYRKFKDQGVDFVGVTNEDESTVKKFMEKMGPDFTYPSALDRSGSVSRGYPVSGIPAAFIVGKDGIVSWQGHPMSGLEGAISKALASEPSAVEGKAPEAKS